MAISATRDIKIPDERDSPTPLRRIGRILAKPHAGPDRQGIGVVRGGERKAFGAGRSGLARPGLRQLRVGPRCKGRFRAVWLECSIETQEGATAVLQRKLADYAQSPPEEFYQGDEVGRPVDFFTPVVAVNRQHPIFSTLISARGYSPARALIGEMKIGRAHV